MHSITLADLRNSASFFDINDIVSIVNGRKKEEIGYFVPKSLKVEFEKFTVELERKRKMAKLERLAAQGSDIEFLEFGLDDEL